MAFYIKIRRVSEDAHKSRYSFEGDGGKTGILEINKQNGEVEQVAPMPDDDKARAFERAAVKLIKAWKSGSLPAETEWAS
jgi:hypothetical protein